MATNNIGNVQAELAVKKSELKALDARIKAKTGEISTLKGQIATLSRQIADNSDFWKPNKERDLVNQKNAKEAALKKAIASKAQMTPPRVNLVKEVAELEQRIKNYENALNSGLSTGKDIDTASKEAEGELVNPEKEAEKTKKAVIGAVILLTVGVVGFLIIRYIRKRNKSKKSK